MYVKECLPIYVCECPCVGVSEWVLSMYDRLMTKLYGRVGAVISNATYLIPGGRGGVQGPVNQPTPPDDIYAGRI